MKRAVAHVLLFISRGLVMNHLKGTTATTFNHLLALARDLFQAPDPNSILELTGPVIQELLLADGALLLLELGEHEYASEFDRNGLMQTVSHNTALYRHARQAIDKQMPVQLSNVLAEPSISLIAFPFPPMKPVGVVSVFWHCDCQPQQFNEPMSILRHIGELTAAALGNVAYRLLIEDRISTRNEEISDSALKHEKELNRRDHLEDELHRISVTDVMTGLLNRRGFFLNAERSFKVAQRQEVPSTIFYADLDELKAVNDGLGHEVGDLLIKDAGRILQASFRDSDVVARLGGDEFAVYTFDAEQPEVLLARIHLNIENFRHSEARPYEISLSIGFVKCDPSSDLLLSDYLSLADKQMYEQKNTRRKSGNDG